MRGLAPGNYFHQWMSEQLAASPLAKELGKTELTFADVKRRDLPPRAEVPDITDEQYERAKYRLHVIGSEVTSGQMLLLPDALPNYQDKHGKQFDKDTFPIVDAVRMSMSYPFLFRPVELYKDGQPHYVVDGGLLSNFPIWLFDSPNPKRPDAGASACTRATSTIEGLPHRAIPRPLWSVPLLKAMFSAATEAWDRENLAHTVSARTVSIPTHAISTTDFNLTPGERAGALRLGQGRSLGVLPGSGAEDLPELVRAGRREHRRRRRPSRLAVAAGRDLKRGAGHRRGGRRARTRARRLPRAHARRARGR